MMDRSRLVRAAWLLGLLLCAPGCQALWGRFNSPHPRGDLGAADAGPGGQPPIDVLFLIDNSPGMHNKQYALAQQIGPFFRALDEIGADYHVGIATSDVGSFPAGVTFPPPAVNYHCQSEDGDNGMLQHTACSLSGRLSAEAQTDCSALCTDASFVPSDPYIAGHSGHYNVPPDIKGADGGAAFDNGPVRAFQCISLVGDTGCDIEGQFEGARRALDGRNTNFLRDNSILAVIFVTDEDDCSVAPANRAQNDPSSKDCTAAMPGFDATYGCFNPDFRCSAMNVVCDQDMTFAGTKTHCTERPSSYLQPVSDYATFLKGLRADPEHRLVLGGIWPPSLSQPGSQFVVQQIQPGGTPGLNRGVGPSSSCYDAATQTAGRPQLRLTSLIDNFTNLFEVDLCAPATYAEGLSHLSARLGELISE